MKTGKRSGLIGRKIGMTRLFKQDGTHVPVTVIKVEPCNVIAFKTKAVEGYTAVQIGTESIKSHRLTKPMQGYFAKKEQNPCRLLHEFRLNDDVSIDVGDVFTVEHFDAGQYVDIMGISIGKGFAGSMKRHGFGGLRASHGVSVSHRSHGSTGNRQDPGKVFKNKKMAGHMGARRVTTLNLSIYAVDKEKGLLFVKGSVPGSKKGIVYVRDAVKKQPPEQLHKQKVQS